MNDSERFNKFGLEFNVYRYYSVGKDALEYTALVTTKWHNFRERFDFELYDHSFNLNRQDWNAFVEALPPLSDIEKDFIVERVMVDIFEYAAVVHRVDESHSHFRELSPVVSEGAIEDYFKRLEGHETLKGPQL